MKQAATRHLTDLDEQTLTPLVCKALARDNAEIITWQQEVLHGGLGDLGAGLVGVYRFHGQARAGEAVLSWALVLKSIHVADGQADAAYLRREWLAYNTTILGSLTGPVIAPQCLATSRQPDNLHWIWLEHLHDDAPSSWSVATYATVAQHFGQWNGSYVTGEPLPDFPWFCRSTAREWAAQAAPEVELLGTLLDHPLIQRLYPNGQAEAILQLWNERERFFQALEHLPQTICHNDAYRRNLFCRYNPDGKEQTVAIDWAYLGQGALGEEVAAMVAGNLGLGEVDWSIAAQFTTHIFDHYLAGLRTVGWAGDPNAVRLGFTAAAAMKYCFPYTLRHMFSEEGQAWLAQVQTQTDRDPFANMVPKRSFLFTLAAEARELLDIHGY